MEGERRVLNFRSDQAHRQNLRNQQLEAADFGRQEMVRHERREKDEHRRRDAEARGPRWINNNADARGPLRTEDRQMHTRRNFSFSFT